jgi:DNA repair protein RadC
MFRGTHNSVHVEPREIVREALRRNAASVIVAHNHPSGSPEPSAADRATTCRIKLALEIFDMRLLDHIVVAGDLAVSFSDRGLL